MRTAPLTIEAALENKWLSYKRKHERASGKTFPGYLNTENLIKTVSLLGVYMSIGEARELSLLIAPEKRGRIQKDDLKVFLSRNCRSLGELLTVLETDLLRDVISAYRKLRDSVRDDGTPAGSVGESNPVLHKRYEALVADLIRIIQGSYVSSENAEKKTGFIQGGTVRPAGPVGTGGPPSVQTNITDIVSIYQLKSGVEISYRTNYNNSQTNMLVDSLTPNLEEWSLLALLVGAGVCDEDTYGNKYLPVFICLCIAIY
jgi:hypothetical protein